VFDFCSKIGQTIIGIGAWAYLSFSLHYNGAIAYQLYKKSIKRQPSDFDKPHPPARRIRFQ
jgi:hypothetical protein